MAVAEVFMASTKLQYQSADGRQGNTPADSSIVRKLFSTFYGAVECVEVFGVPVNAECKRQVDEDGIGVVMGTWEWDEDAYVYERRMASIERMPVH